MKVDILASGSNGNCIALTSGKETILVDAGIAKTKIEKRLLEVGITPNNITAILITHAHKDHTKGLPLANKYKIPVFAADEEWKSIDLVEEDYRWNFPSGKGFKVGGFDVVTFKAHHDAFDPVGFAVISNDFKVSVCLDSGHVDSIMLDTMKDSNVYIIESNHDVGMLEASKYHNRLKARILSDVGHLSNEQTAAALSELVQGKGEQIYLTHLSSNNNMPALAEMTTKKALYQKGLIENKHYKLEVIE